VASDCSVLVDASDTHHLMEHGGHAERIVLTP
jgi:hypothetical protein